MLVKGHILGFPPPLLFWQVCGGHIAKRRSPLGTTPIGKCGDRIAKMGGSLVKVQWLRQSAVPPLQWLSQSVGEDPLFR